MPWRAAYSMYNQDTIYSLHLILACLLITLLLLLLWAWRMDRRVYLLDFQVYRPPDSCKCSQATFLKQAERHGTYTAETLQFMEKILNTSGIGEQSHMPARLFDHPPWKAQVSMQARRQESEAVMFTCVKDLLHKCKTSPSEVDILVVNCSVFNPTPSLAAAVINQFRLKPTVITYNLSGMGCSAGLLSIALVRELLQVYPGRTALVVSLENITENVYLGNQCSMTITNCLFRLGGAAALLSNKRRHWWSARYELQHLVRTHMGSDDEAYNCIFQQEDSEGMRGIKLDKALMRVAGRAVMHNLLQLGPLVLPWAEQFRYLWSLVAQRVISRDLETYKPSFNGAFEHFCIHTGGRGILDSMEKQLGLSPSHLVPSRETLRRYGNTSSSSIWYVLAYIETKQGVKRGERVWQLGFGSGFKVNSTVWYARRSIFQQHAAFADTPSKPIIRTASMP